jgi:hypothetical protein
MHGVSKKLGELSNDHLNINGGVSGYVGVRRHGWKSPATFGRLQFCMVKTEKALGTWADGRGWRRFFVDA